MKRATTFYFTLALGLSLVFLYSSPFRQIRAFVERGDTGGNESWQSALKESPLNTFTVTNTNDAGPGSLRKAIEDANNNPGLDMIAFNIGGGGVQTIAPTSPLPNITDPIIIDGTTQPGYAGAPIIELNGANAGVTSGLRITGGNSTVKGLVINRFISSGIILQTNGGNTIQGNFIGTNINGTAALGNTIGISIFTPNNITGGTTPGARNIISGNNQHGVKISAATDNIVQGISSARMWAARLTWAMALMACSSMACSSAPPP